MCKYKSLIIIVAVLVQFTCLRATNIKTEIKYLSGIDKDNLVEWEFFCSAGMNSGKWTTIGVPSCWELQGFGAYNYGHDPFEERLNEYGLYKHHFEVPKSWKNREVKIVFEGVMTDAEVKINGRLAGAIHQGSFYEFYYSITDLLKYGEKNILEVKVDKASSNKSINYAERQADFWIFGGIYRPVYLEAFPKEHIQRVAIDAQASGTIKTDIFVSSSTASSVQLSLEDLSGNKIEELTIDEITKENGKWQVFSKASDIKTWNPESPNLYNLQIRLLGKDNEILHKASSRIGFRTVEVLDGDGIYMNGQRIKFKGVNRHSFYPTSGRTTSKALSIEHVKMMKEMNMNAVRMAHYPPDVHFLDACDSLGLFVINELCTWQKPALNTQIGGKLVKELVIRDVNHPSIILWANGNEGGWNTELDDKYAVWDIQKREVIHPWGIYNKTNTLHYIGYDYLAYDGFWKDKIFFPTEFLHGLYDGGHGAGLDDYWNKMWHMPLCAGGFLWDFADEGIVRVDKENSLDFDGNHAPDGIVGPYGEKEGSFWAIREIWSPIYIEDRFIRSDFNGLFRVENRYHFTNLNECTMIVKWIRFEGPKGSVSYEIMDERSVALPSVAPDNKGTFSIEKPSNWHLADALYLTAIDKHGNEIYTWSYPVKTPQQLSYSQLSLDGKGKLKYKEGASTLLIQTKDLDLIFSKENAQLLEVKRGEKIIPLVHGPVILGQQSEIDSFYFNMDKSECKITAVFQKSKDRVEWVIHENGLVDLLVEMKSKYWSDAIEGITFSFPENQVAGMKWLGDGPCRVWRNRMKGTQFKIWESEYNNSVTGESGFVYPEFKGFYSGLYWAKVNGGNNNGFTVYCHTPHTYLRMLTPDQPAAPNKGATVTNFPKGDISFVKNIPAIGTKFMKADQLGPQSQNDMIIGRDREKMKIELTFDFEL